jgi:8-oxo-dGTP pyrophosphatase MutT (NUDIX family)
VDIDHVRRKLAGHSPEPLSIPEHKKAGVAVVLREGPRSAEVLLIERAHHPSDPWSGHMAFPGGRMDDSDESTRATAARETFEEVGLSLEGAEYLGHVDELTGNRRRTPRLVVAAHAFHVRDHGELTLDPTEVQQALWFPLAGLHDRERQVEHVIQDMPEARFPGVLVGEPGRHVVWGLTFRFLDRMLQTIEHPFDRTWGNLSTLVDASGKPLFR